jgi:hypothetical protein
MLTFLFFVSGFFQQQVTIDDAITASVALRTTGQLFGSRLVDFNEGVATFDSLSIVTNCGQYHVLVFSVPVSVFFFCLFLSFFFFEYLQNGLEQQQQQQQQKSVQNACLDSIVG